jgi:YbbR domain-containing protein
MNFVRFFKNLFQFNRTNWKAIILCFLAASIFWLFSAFNKDHTTTIRFPLRFEFDNQKFVSVNPLPHHLSINVSGSGWELFRKTLGINLPELVIPLDRPVETKKILTGTITPILTSQLGGLQIIYMATDTLHVYLDERISKTFSLSADLSKVRYREGFGNTGLIEIVPDSVVIDGPQSIIKSIPDTIVLPVQGKQISKSFRDELEVPLFNSESINRNPPVISVSVKVGAVETIECMLNVKVVNKPRTGKYSFTDRVKALIQIPTDKSEDFRESQWQVNATLDLIDVKKGSHQMYPKIIGLPVYAQVISIDSLSFKID